MRPSQGKPHKACATLCIHGGVAPAIFARADSGRGALKIMRDSESAYRPGLLAMVGDPVRLRGRVFRQGELLVVDAPRGDIRRI